MFCHLKSAAVSCLLLLASSGSMASALKSSTHSACEHIQQRWVTQVDLSEKGYSEQVAKDRQQSCESLRGLTIQNDVALVCSQLSTMEQVIGCLQHTSGKAYKRVLDCPALAKAVVNQNAESPRYAGDQFMHELREMKTAALRECISSRQQ